MDRSSKRSDAMTKGSSVASLRHLARLAGLSKSTVSYALSDSGRIKASTRRRVQALARKVGYTPNLIAATLASLKGNRPVRAIQIAFVTDLTNNYNTRWYRATQPHLEKLGYVSRSFDLRRHQLSAEGLRKLLYHQGYSGVIFSEIREETSKVFTEDWSPFCVLTTRRVHFQSAFDQVRTNPFEGVTTAWRRIRAAGYRRIGFLLCRHRPYRVLDDFEREGALLVMQQDLSADEVALPPYLGDLGDAPAILAWLHRHQPDIVAGFNAYHHVLLREAGFRMPRDFAFVSLHGQDSATTMESMAHVDLGEAEIPRICAEYMDGLIRHRRRGYPESRRDILAPVTWVPGPSFPG